MVLAVCNFGSHHEDVQGSGDITPCKLNFGLWLANHSGHYTPGQVFWYTLDRRQGGPHRLSGHSGKQKRSFPSYQSNPSHPARRFSWLQNMYNKKE